MVLKHPSTLAGLWDHDTWTVFILRPWMSIPVSLLFIGTWIVYTLAREPSRDWENHTRSWRRRVSKPPSWLGFAWFFVELVVCGATAFFIVGEMARLVTGTYTPGDWTDAKGLGTYMWLSRVAVFWAMAGCLWDYYRFAHVHWIEALWLVAHLWLTGTWMSSPHTHSTASVVVPCGFVMDRALVAAYRMQVERGGAALVDIARGGKGDSMAAHALQSARRITRLAIVMMGILLFGTHSFAGNHHPESDLHSVTVGIHAFLVVAHEVVMLQARTNGVAPAGSYKKDDDPDVVHSEDDDDRRDTSSSGATTADTSDADAASTAKARTSETPKRGKGKGHKR